MLTVFVVEDRFISVALFPAKPITMVMSEHHMTQCQTAVFCATITTNEGRNSYMCPSTLGYFNNNIGKLQIVNYTLGFEDCYQVVQ